MSLLNRPSNWWTTCKRRLPRRLVRHAGSIDFSFSTRTQSPASTRVLPICKTKARTISWRCRSRSSNSRAAIFQILLAARGSWSMVAILPTGVSIGASSSSRLLSTGLINSLKTQQLLNSSQWQRLSLAWATVGRGTLCHSVAGMRPLQHRQAPKKLRFRLPSSSLETIWTI